MKQTEAAEAGIHRVSDWSGSTGDNWVSNQIRLDAMLEVFGTEALAAAAPAMGERVLDIGCGAGATSFALARKVGPDGQVLGVDISQALLDQARRIAPADISVSFERADAGEAPLPQAAFDLLFSRFGVMFFDDPARAFTHMRRALKPGGRLAFVCWRGAKENDWVRLPMGAIEDLIPIQPPADPEAPGPFSFGDQARIERILGQAGFADVATRPFDHDIPFGRGENRNAALDDAVAMAFAVGPLSRALADRPECLRERAASAVREAFERRPGETSVMIDGAAWIVTARNPAA
ncbi:class I SAM-dependent methyltransferase [Novosphingobium sp.]|jgi:SAM-dependent methyltransferase|uniref:class I SAM-dependent methyltransferase n=1 Tax=Novosphingobium sp. TaxID=1874826 RepID=UPI002FE1927A